MQLVHIQKYNQIVLKRYFPVNCQNLIRLYDPNEKAAKMLTPFFNELRLSSCNKDLPQAATSLLCSVN